ncbi:hypothetical protein Syun_028210 [Stephania yunnanensis]|uniref:Uncharacterized protein n=1 Tax=Stephania yunnanensis TaxID=152371 RepID=A0AAP0HNJ7_9MAGN
MVSKVAMKSVPRQRRIPAKRRGIARTPEAVDALSDANEERRMATRRLQPMRERPGARRSKSVPRQRRRAANGGGGCTAIGGRGPRQTTLASNATTNNDDQRWGLHSRDGSWHHLRHTQSPLVATSEAPTPADGSDFRV